MRLWHYKLIPVLPDKMLKSQWREIIAIKRQIEKHTLRHRLVSYVQLHDLKIFLCYTNMVLNEMAKRNIRYNTKLFYEILEFTNSNEMYINDSYYPEHNDRYLKQCLYNLQEKMDRGIVTKQEWDKISVYIKELGGRL